MLQFNKSQITNTNAVWPDVDITSSIGLQVVLEFTQSYDESVTLTEADIINNPGINGQQYIIFQISGSNVPTPSGQYTVNVWEGDIQPFIWGQVAITWGDIQAKWNDTEAVSKTKLLSTERAYVSGSNEQTIIQYVSPDENGTYTTYNG